ncbi:9305_t:CDS:2 [Funneliformis mosseae]|uniref:9305_t:CDS:1 n=1 Tax=Funneliformis mosseae TaxID=27381 RepID=A0A9N9FB84_FUNMO|nr:9305_t:CDS:2 [Funneliformis mosseae]
MAQVPLYTFPVDDGTKSYHVKGGSDDKLGSQWIDPKLYQKFHLVRYDYRGMGNSDNPNYPLDLNAYDLFAVVTKLLKLYYGAVHCLKSPSDHLVLATESLLDPQGNFEKVLFGMSELFISFKRLSDQLNSLAIQLLVIKMLVIVLYGKTSKELNKDIMEFVEKV